MPELTVFDVFRVNRALEGRLADGDTVQVVAADEIDRSYWVVTDTELLVLTGDDISARVPLERGELTLDASSDRVDVRVRDTGPAGQILLASFRKHNKLTQHLQKVLAEPPAPTS
jgi:hypothetical protein